VIDSRLGEILASLDFPMEGTWSQEGLNGAQGRVLRVGTLTLNLAHPGLDVLEQEDQALSLSVPDLERLVAAAGALGHVDLASPAAMAEALRQAAGVHFKDIYVELSWEPTPEGGAWSLHQAKEVVAGQADSPSLAELNSEIQIPLFAAQAAFGAEVQLGEWLGFELDGESSLVLRLLWESARPAD
jgi:hypothetical protein